MADSQKTQVEVVEVPAQMEFRLINPTEKGFLKHIEWNKEELEAAVKAKVAEYVGAAYTEETVKAAKNDRAELNKLLKAIEDRRKKVKETINRPYVEFEAELKEVTALISGQIAEIDKQLNEFETREREEKREKIRKAYDEAIGDLREVLPFDKVFDLRFLNKTYKLKDAVSEVKGKVETVKRDLETIGSMCGKYSLNAKDVYVKTLDLSKALAEEKRLKDLEEKMEAERIRKEKEAEEQRKAEEERERERQELAKKLEKEQEEPLPFGPDNSGSAIPLCPAGIKSVSFPESEKQAANDPEIESVKCGEFAQAVAQAAQDTPIDPFRQQETEHLVRAKFYAIASKKKLKDLLVYMKHNGIKYGKVE